jgi:hypothetical protein
MWEVLEIITPADAEGYFFHAGYFWWDRLLLFMEIQHCNHWCNLCTSFRNIKQT